MRQRDAIAGLVAIGTLAGCAGEAVDSQSPESTVPSPAVTLDIGTISVGGEVAFPSTTTLHMPTTTLQEMVVVDRNDGDDEVWTQIDLEKYTPHSTTTTEAPESTSTTEILPTWEDLHVIKKESIVQGNKIADITATNPNGEVLVNIPMFIVTEPNNRKVTDEQLKRGSILEVAHPEINPENIGFNNGMPEMALLGDNKSLQQLHTVSFGHRIDRIYPDLDGNSSNGNEGNLQRVYERIDEFVPGAVLTIKLTEQAGGETLRYEFIGVREISNFEIEGGGTLVQTAYDLRSGVGIPEEYSDKSTLSLVACTPKGSTSGRIVADFILIEN